MNRAPQRVSAIRLPSLVDDQLANRNIARAVFKPEAMLARKTIHSTPCRAIRPLERREFCHRARVRQGRSLRSFLSLQLRAAEAVRQSRSLCRPRLFAVATALASGAAIVAAPHHERTPRHAQDLDQIRPEPLHGH